VKSIHRAAAAAFALIASLAPSLAQACACGCNVFDVGANSLLPMGTKLTAYVDYDFMDQNQNFSGVRDAPAANNSDKKLKSQFLKLGVEYRFNDDWKVTVDVPVADREFHTDDGGGVQGFHHTALGDVRITASYSGFSKDQSSGLILGVKLATGDFKYSGFDRDTEIGTGSTDLLVGGYHIGSLTTDETWRYFTQVIADLPVASQGGYDPGAEVDGAVGVSYGSGKLIAGHFRITPILQVIASQRAKDTGPAANPDGSGYTRVMLSPGIQVSSGLWSLYGDVEVPVYQHINGDQLVAPVLFKMIVSRSF
jgi:hypothetical protein